jgi:2-polyprenyl-6-methoxyphenol hydroxylase-like FAD-dependent oxidoreductase
MTAAPPESAADEPVRDVQQTACCVVGGGPGGMVLALLLARRGVPVTLLEAHHDFDRQFRGDTLHPAILEILDEIGLAEPLLRRPHTRWHRVTLRTADGPFTPVDFRRLRTRFPFILVMPQEDFLQFLADEARKYPSFRLVMGANVERLVEEDGVVRGVRYRAADGWHEVRAALTVGADGRFSRVRHLAGFRPVVTSPPIQVLWFRLPRLPDDTAAFANDPPTGGPMMASLRISGHPQASVGGFAWRGPRGAMLAFDRLSHWQVGYLFPDTEQYQEIHAAGLAAFRRFVAGLEPRFAPHVESLTDWRQLSLLSVAFSHCRRWYRPGLLLIGDAAHVMTPAAGSGIKYAIEDAVAAANRLADPLKAGRVRLQDLAAVQRRRERPARLIQTAGAFAQRRFLPFLLRRGPLRVPWLVRTLLGLPWLRDLPGRLFALGLWREHVSGRGAVSGPPA